MISKLVVWGDTRADAVARLRRVLDEYRVVGVRTTVPFFRWLIDEPEFIEGRFDTTYLDRVLADRRGRRFVDADDTAVRDAAIAAALGAWLQAHGASAAPVRDGGAWRRAARLEGLR
jgi:acetyl/propionyl-CoA carboxylase alpha subunit